MQTLEGRLRSRFEWGLIADISSPDYETRMAILRKKEELDGYQVNDEVIKYIATNIKSNIRELEGALNKRRNRNSAISSLRTKNGRSLRSSSSIRWQSTSESVRKTSKERNEIPRLSFPDRLPCISAGRSLVSP